MQALAPTTRVVCCVNGRCTSRDCRLLTWSAGDAAIDSAAGDSNSTSSHHVINSPADQLNSSPPNYLQVPITLSTDHTQLLTDAAVYRLCIVYARLMISCSDCLEVKREYYQNCFILATCYLFSGHSYYKSSYYTVRFGWLVAKVRSCWDCWSYLLIG